MRHVLVCGSRGFKNRALVESVIGNLTPGSLVITGGCKGPDRWAHRVAFNNGLLTGIFPVSEPQWTRYGRAAGPKRNEAMVACATHCIAFWDGKSRGTKGTVEAAVAKGIPVVVYDRDGGMTPYNFTEGP